MINKDQFRQVMSSFPTGVTVVTTLLDGESVGVTINSFTSVSLDPVMISFCLGRYRKVTNAFLKTDSFCINILSSDQEKLSATFANPHINPWPDIDYFQENQSIRLRGCVGHLKCFKETIVEAGDHYIIIGRVQEIQHDDTKKPLIYYARGYHSL